MFLALRPNGARSAPFAPWSPPPFRLCFPAGASWVFSSPFLLRRLLLPSTPSPPPTTTTTIPPFGDVVLQFRSRPTRRPACLAPPPRVLRTSGGLPPESARCRLGRESRCPRTGSSLRLRRPPTTSTRVVGKQLVRLNLLTTFRHVAPLQNNKPRKTPRHHPPWTKIVSAIGGPVPASHELSGPSPGCRLPLQILFGLCSRSLVDHSCALYGHLGIRDGVADCSS